jgi:NAD(P)-dependent dehydrogenase (short-subunit alcohol dehydrogenase family)
MGKGSYRELFDLAGQVAVVTGGVGILGRRFCSGLADFGAKVAVVDLDEATAVEFAVELSSTYDVECVGVGCDVSDPVQTERMTERVESALGAISILHNNAGSKSSDLDKCFAPTEEYSLETWREMMAVNLDGAFLVAKAIGSRMAARGRGSIIQTGSIYGAMAPDQRIYEGSHYLGRAINSPPVYSASKAGVIGLTKYLATYWAAKGVRVNTLSPGGVESGQNDVFKERYSSRIPMGRMAQGDEMVGALIFLASDASSYVTGQNILVDGGLSAW